MGRTPAGFRGREAKSRDAGSFVIQGFGYIIINVN